MCLNRVFIEGYKNFTDKFEIEFSKGLNIIVRRKYNWENRNC